MSDYKEIVTASDCIGDNIKTFADYTIETKLPHYLDGLKAINRRILVTLNRMGPGLKKELSVGGEVVTMHPHGDSSINTAISVMAQPFTHIVPLVFSASNIGNYDGDEPAAARYVDVAEADVARELFFTDINPNMFDMVPCESEIGTEPAYLIPRLPTSLIISSLAIAVGYQSKIPSMGIAEVCKLTKEYIKLRSENIDWQTKVRKTLIQYMLPDFATDCLLRNSKQLLAEYRNGNFDAPILLDGTMEVTKDQIAITTLPPGKVFRKTTFDVGMTMAKVKNSWENQNFQQMEGFSGDEQGIMKGYFICVVRRGMNPFDVLATLKKKLQFTGYWRPERHYTDSTGKFRSETPLTLLDAWYNMRYNAVLGDLKQTLNNMVDQQRRLLALIIICDHDEEVFHIFKKAKDKEATVPELVNRFKLTKYQAKFIASLQMHQITAKGKDDLMAELEDIKKKMEELQKKFHQIPQMMIASIEKFEKMFVEKPYTQGKMEFDLSRRCIVPKYVGAAIYKENGHILVSDENEFDKILKNFDPEFIDFKLFGRSGDLIALGSEEETEGIDLPKYIKAEYVGKVGRAKYTACMFKKGGASIVSGLVPRQDAMMYTVPLECSDGGKTRFIVVDKSGHIHSELVDDKHLRKSVSSGPTMREAVWIGPGNMNDVVIVHGNSSQPNNLIIERTDLSTAESYRLKKIPVGSWRILAVASADTKRIYLNIPAELRQRCTVRHIVIDNIGDVVKPGERVNCTFGRTTIKSDFTVSPIRKKSSILVAKRV